MRAMMASLFPASEAMHEPISVLLADDHAILVDSLAGCLESSGHCHVVGVARSGRQALDEARRLRPRVVVLDIDMPGLSAFEAAAEIQRHSPETRVVFLSAFFHDRYVEQALACKAAAYVTKTEPLAVVIKAIQAAARGSFFFSPEVQARIVVDPAGLRVGGTTQSRGHNLTARELEILRYLARGMSRKEIATAASISVNTVNRHLTSVMDKLDIHDKVELTRFAIREGLATA